MTQYNDYCSLARLRDRFFEIRQLISEFAPMSSRAGTRKPVLTGSILLKHIKRLATHNTELGEISDAAVYIRGNLIEWVGITTDLPEPLQKADVVHDMSNHVVLPGLVNTHHHSEILSMHMHAQ